MAIETKICGIDSAAALDAAAKGGADMVGLNFYEPSPRYVGLDQAAALAARVPAGITKVAVVVDPDDAKLEQIIRRVALDMIQLHGGESPRRAAEIRARFELPVMKVIKIAVAEDFGSANPFIDVADRLLFDAKPPKHMTEALPGGNAVSFDWRLLAGHDWPLPWILSGGLNSDNVAESICITGARAVDVSSGVERRPGLKDPARIAAFLAAVQATG